LPFPLFHDPTKALAALGCGAAPCGCDGCAVGGLTTRFAGGAVAGGKFSTGAGGGLAAAAVRKSSSLLQRRASRIPRVCPSSAVAAARMAARSALLRARQAARPALLPGFVPGGFGGVPGGWVGGRFDGRFLLPCSESKSEFALSSDLGGSLSATGGGGGGGGGGLIRIQGHFLPGGVFESAGNLGISPSGDHRRFASHTDLFSLLTPENWHILK
jgi:hypothetical protein